MNALRRMLGDYRRLRRSLGYKLRRSEMLLQQFIDFLDAVGARTITTERALECACQPIGSNSNWWSQRPTRPRRASPYLYRERDSASLIQAAEVLSSPLRVATYQTLIGLLAVTGLRVGEAINLNQDDFDAKNGVLLIRRAKFNKHAVPIAAQRQGSMDSGAPLDLQSADPISP